MGRDFHRETVRTRLHLNHFPAAKPSGFPSSPRARSFVRKSNQSLGVSCILDQPEVALRKQNRKDAKIETINQIFLQESSNLFAATHQPDVFAATLAKPADQTLRRFVDEYKPVTLARRPGVGKTYVAMVEPVSEPPPIRSAASRVLRPMIAESTLAKKSAIE
jgi:hypothetical protein